MSSYRPRPAQDRSPLESLVYSCLPSLAPPRQRPSSAIPSGRSSAASSSRPASRIDGTTVDEKEEKERHSRVKELMEFCEEILDSRLPSSAPLDLGTLPDTARRILAAGSGGGSKGAGQREEDRALRFSSAWNKLDKGKTLATPLPHLQFLLALSELNPNATPPSSSLNAQSQSARATFASNQNVPVASSSKSRLAAPASIPTPAPEWIGPGKGKSKAEVLSAWRSSQSQPPCPQHLLLRDALYLLQGIDGRYVRFAIRPARQQNPYLTERGKRGEGMGFPLGKEGEALPSEEDEEEEVVGLDFVADEQVDGHISIPTRTVITQISEMGVMYRKVTTFTKEQERRKGMTEQSLCHFLHHELSEYHRLLAVLESQMSLTAPSSSPDGPSQPAEGSGLTLLRLGLWTEEMRLKMKMMVQVVEDVKSNYGGALVSKVHAHTSHGDPVVRDFMEQVLEEVSKPFFATLQRWIFSGDLHDPFQEFFVQLNSDTRDGRISPYYSGAGAGGDMGFEGGLSTGGGVDEAHAVWEKKYVFVKKMVPGFVSEEFGKKIFSTGRSLNFIRYSCRDSDWIETQAKLANAGRALKYSDLAGLERSIDVAYSIASQRLLETFFDKFNLLDHLRALKSYLMLGAGDFTEHLMEALAPRLSKPAASLYRHHLTSDLETAIRASNAQHDSLDVLRRLDARVLEYSPGEIGWDCFALEYKIEAPLNAVLDGKAMVEYDRLFHHLWRLKRVESALSQGWMRVTSNSRLFESIQSLRRPWHDSRQLQAQMVHFIRQLQAFCQLEVIECSWQSLMDFTDKREGDLDALIAAHRAYLDRVVRKILLLGSKRDKQEIILDYVREALDICLKFRDVTDDLYAHSLAEATRLDRTRDSARGLTGPPSPDDNHDPLRNTAKLNAILQRLATLKSEFKSRMDLITQLTAQHPDLDVRFLAIRLAFNGFWGKKEKDRERDRDGKSKSSRRGQP